MLRNSALGEGVREKRIKCFLYCREVKEKNVTRLQLGNCTSARKKVHTFEGLGNKLEFLFTDFEKVRSWDYQVLQKESSGIVASFGEVFGCTELV